MVNYIHPSAIIGPGVILGAGNTVGPNVILLGPLRIGNGNWIGPGSTIGTPPEVYASIHSVPWDEVSQGETTIIGDNNIIREGSCIQRGYYHTTQIGSDCFLMSRAYIAHDCTIQDEVTLAANVSLAGHCVVQSKANLGLSSMLHQRSVIGAGAMIGMGTVVTKNVSPYTKYFGVPGRIHGSNKVAMKKNGFTEEDSEDWENIILNATDLLQIRFFPLQNEIENWRNACLENGHS